MALTRLREAAEKAKIELSTVQETEINLPFITATADGPIHMLRTLKRSEFEQMTDDLLARTRGPFKRAIEDAGISLSDLDHILLVGGSTRMPAVQSVVADMSGGKEPNKGVNPDEVVALGAAIQAGVLTGDVSDILLLDVTPLTLGVETEGGVFTKMIERNTTIPTRRSEIFTTAANSQPEVEIHVMQGERAMSSDNMSLGRFKLLDIPPAPRGIPQIEVTFDIDANGIVSVSAKDLGTGQTQQVTITGGTALDSSDIDQMIKDAEAHAADDAERKEAVEVRNSADHTVYTVGKQLAEHGDASRTMTRLRSRRNSMHSRRSSKTRALPPSPSRRPRERLWRLLRSSVRRCTKLHRLKPQQRLGTRLAQTVMATSRRLRSSRLRSLKTNERDARPEGQQSRRAQP